MQRGDSANKERGGRHLLTNHKLRGLEFATASAAGDSAAESGQQQARDTLYVPILFVLLRLLSVHARVRIFARKCTAPMKIPHSLYYEKLPRHKIKIIYNIQASKSQRKL